MDFDRIATEVVAELLNPLRERRDYDGNQLDKLDKCDECNCDKCQCGRRSKMYP